MNMKMGLLALILPALILSTSCKKNASTPSGPEPSITGPWQWQYTTQGLQPGEDTLYPRQDSTVEVTFSIDHSFSLLLNGIQTDSGTWKWQGSNLVLTSAAAINHANYAEANIFTGTNPSEYTVQASQGDLLLTVQYIIPGATGPYSTPAQPTVIVLTPAAVPLQNE